MTLKEAWHDPVWSKVISGIILFALGAGLTGLTYFFDWWPAIVEFAQAVYRYALLPSALPNWIVAVLGLLAAPTIFILLAVLWRKVFPLPQEPAWKNYRTDTFFKLKWQWRLLDNGVPYELVTLCPVCSLQLIPNNVDYGGDRIVFKCELCRQTVAEFDESIDSLENRIKRIIQREIRIREASSLKVDVIS